MEVVTSSDFDAKVLQADKPVIVDFFADWCGPCRRLAPMFEELSGEVDGAVFVKVDVEASPDIAGQFGVRSIPTIIVFKGGEEVDRVVGLPPKEQLKQAVVSHL